MQIAIRTDASNLIGSGHVMRCLTLAKGLRAQGHEIQFVCRNHPGNMNHQISKAGFDVAVLEQPADPITSSDPNDYAAWLSVPQQIDADATIAALKFHPDWMIIDHYGIDRVWETIVRPAVGGIMAIDDLANRRHDCDLLLDQNCYANQAERYGDLLPTNCRLLLGPRFAILRDEFHEQRAHLTARDVTNPSRVLVFFGGYDRPGDTLTALAALDGVISESTNIDIVVGSGNVHLNKIVRYATRHGNWSVHTNITYVASLMARADFSLGAGGTTIYERMFMDLPTITVAAANNQEHVLTYCHAQNYVHYLGRSEDADSAHWQAAISDMLAGNIRYRRYEFDSDRDLLWRELQNRTDHSAALPS